MKPILLVTALLLCLPFSVNASDNSAPVKVTPLLKTTKTWEGKPLVYPQGQAEVTSMLVEIAGNTDSGWHSHPVPSFAYILEGSLEISTSTGETKVFRQGDVLAEVVDTIHNTRALDGKPVKMFLMYTGAVDKKLRDAHPEFAPSSPKK